MSNNSRKKIDSYKKQIRSSYIEGFKKSSRFISLADQYKQKEFKFEFIQQQHQLDTILSNQNISSLLSIVTQSNPCFLALINWKIHDIATLIIQNLNKPQALLLCGNMALLFEQFAQISFQTGLVANICKQAEYLKGEALSIYIWALSELSFHSNAIKVDQIIGIVPKLQSLIEDQFIENVQVFKLILYLSESNVFSKQMIFRLCQKFDKVKKDVNRVSIYLSVEKILLHYKYQMSSVQSEKLFRFLIKIKTTLQKKYLKCFYNNCSIVALLSNQQFIIRILDYDIFKVQDQSDIYYWKFISILTKRISPSFFKKDILDSLFRQLDNTDKQIIYLCLKSIQNIICNDFVLQSNYQTIAYLKSSQLYFALQKLCYIERSSIKISTISEQIMKILEQTQKL